MQSQIAEKPSHMKWANTITGAEVPHFLMECTHSIATMQQVVSVNLVCYTLLNSGQTPQWLLNRVSDSHHKERKDGHITRDTGHQ